MSTKYSNNVVRFSARTAYEAASIDDLVAATGLKRGSLYQAFGSKRGVFLKVLQDVFGRLAQSILR